MNLLFVIDNLGPGGAQRQMINLARGLAGRGHKVTFFVYYEDSHYKKMLDDVSIPIIIYRKKRKYDLSPIVKIHEMILKNKYDITLSFLDTPNFYAEIAHLGVNATKLVVSNRLAFPNGKISIRERLMLEGHRIADRIVTNSYHNRRQIEEKFPWSRRKIQTIYNGCDLDTFRPVAVRDFKKDGVLSLVVVSSVSFKKNSINLAKAIDICKRQYKINVCVTWIGETYISGQGIVPFEKTKEFLENANLGMYWHWEGVKDKIFDHIVKHDALIHPSYYEGLPNSVCEALSCGKPVLVSNVCDHPILIRDGVRGYLFDPHSPMSIANSIVRMYNSTEEEYCDMCRNARFFAEKNLSISKYVEAYEDLFLSLID